MQNMNFKLGTLVGIGVVVVTILFQLIIGFALNSTIIFYSVLFGLAIAVIASLCFKINNLSEEKNISTITLDLDEEESLIIEGAAKYQFESQVYNGKLFLTSRRLIFKTMMPKSSEALFVSSLKSVSNIYLKRGLCLKGMSLEIDSDLTQNRFMVDYPSSWKEVIDGQIKDYQDANKTL